MSDKPKSLESKSVDISWKVFSICYLVLVLANLLFDEFFRPMRGANPIEMVLWYIGYPTGFLIIPSLLILLMHFIFKRKLDAPKKTTLIYGVVIMAFSLSMTASHIIVT